MMYMTIPCFVLGEHIDSVTSAYGLMHKNTQIAALGSITAG